MSLLEISAEDAARFLGSEDPPHWVTYQDEILTPERIESLLQRDIEFQQYWHDRLMEEVSIFQKMLSEADFLEASISDFYSLGDKGSLLVDILYPVSNTMRSWVEHRLSLAETRLNLMFS